MAALNISLTDELRDFIQKRVDSGDFGTPTEYMRHLIRIDKEKEALRRLEKALLDGIESGPAGELTHQTIEAIRNEVLEKAAKKSSNGKKNGNKP